MVGVKFHKRILEKKGWVSDRLLIISPKNRTVVNDLPSDLVIEAGGILYHLHKVWFLLYVMILFLII